VAGGTPATGAPSKVCVPTDLPHARQIKLSLFLYDKFAVGTIKAAKTF
jgi:hypothetical protein